MLTIGPDFADDLRELDVADALIDLVRRCTSKAHAVHHLAREHLIGHYFVAEDRP